ncbi:MAG: response regulator transcription factor, partial [Clostridiales bacterium]
FDGFYVCRTIRKISKTPIIIISARNGEMDQILGMELGADDYILKPFSFEILIAKIKSSLRRIYGEYSETPKNANTNVNTNANTNINALILDHKGFKVTYLNKTIELSKNEFKLINLFIENKDCIIEREKILEELWDENLFVDDNTITVNVSRVKSRFMELGFKDVIKTKRGVGYRLDSTVFD